MARSITASGDQCRSASVTGPGSVGSIAIWIKPNWNSGDGVVHGFWFFEDLADSGECPGFQKFSDNNIYVGFFHGGVDYRIAIADAGLFVSGTWAHHVFTWDDAANDARYYVDNVEKGSRTSAFTTSAATTGLRIGNHVPWFGNTNTNAALDQFCVFDRVLNSSERAALLLGVSPVRMRATHYYPLWGLESPEPGLVSGAPSLSLTGTARANGAPVRPFTRARSMPHVSAAGLLSRLQNEGLFAGSQM